ncbi:MAG: AMP-binding protein [Proteobacteria bacterium]|nr:AMP-binding protein [Pseudomonadota bacterium]
MGQKATGTLTVGNFLKVAAIRYRDRESFFCTSTGRRFTFGQTNQRVNGLANGLLGLGLKKGDACAFLCTNRVEIAEIYFALAKIGVLGIPLNYRLAPAEMIELMDYCEAKALIFDPWFSEIAGQVREALPRIEYFVGLGEGRPGFAHDYERLVAESSKAEPPVTVSEEDHQYLNLTSGTTGLPKAYLLTHYNNAQLPIFAGALDLVRDDVLLTVFPAFGRVGFAWILMGVYTGARNVLHQFNPLETLGLIQSEKVTISNWVPTMAALILSLPQVKEHDLGSLRALVFAGSPLPSAIREQVKKAICPHMYEYYGLQETGAVVLAKPEDKEAKPDSVGQQIFTAEIRIIDPEGRDVAQGERGEIIMQSPTATAGYYKNEAKTRETFVDGWFHSGDIGYFDEDGHLYIAGRVKDMIISGGQNVFAVEVEDMLLKHPAVADCAVIGLPHDTWGEMVAAVLIKAPGVQTTDEELTAYCKKNLAGFKVPKKFIWVEGPLPRTATGKVTKFVLVDQYNQG